MKTDRNSAFSMLAPTGLSLYHFACTILFAVFLPALAGGASLNGTYTIGGVSPDYASFASAVSDLAVQGVSGPVVFLVRNGTYNEQITISPVTGASATNTITFESESGDSTTVILTYASSSFLEPWTLRLYNADHIIFRKMTIEASGTNYAQAVRLTENAQYNSFLNNIVKGTATTSTLHEVAVIFCGIGDNHHSTFNNNQIIDGSYGLYFSGNFIIIENFSKNSFNTTYSEKILVDGNTFSNQYYQGVYLEFVLGATIRNNLITSNTTDFSYGVLP
ncbi:MAG: hypothetical protein IPM98_06230 [Lewinellaceae bacterium]|nr:hypothetical protein [Lewinellaceae bacterium]